MSLFEIILLVDLKTVFLSGAAPFDQGKNDLLVGTRCARSRREPNFLTARNSGPLEFDNV